MNQALIAELIRCGAVRFGKFVLSSGRESNYYIDIKKAVTSPKILRLIASEMSKHITTETRIAGLELGAVPIAVALSLETSKPFIIIRKEAKLHGTQKLFEGEIVSGEIVLVVEDVTTTGASAARSITVLRDAGAIVEKVLTVVDREEGAEETLRKMEVKLISIVKVNELLRSTSTSETYHF